MAGLVPAISSPCRGALLRPAVRVRLRALALLGGLVLPVAAEAAECRQLLARGARISDTYVMDFGPSDKLYVYVMRMPNGSVEKCTSQRPLGRR